MKTVRSYKKMKQHGEKIVMCTAYDYPSGKFVQQAAVDIILVGDSLGMVVLGYPDTLNVTMDDMVHHSRAARRGADDTFIVADLPFGGYHINLDATKANAFRLIQQGGANAVKLEGGKPSRLEAIRAIVDCEIPVVAHLGLTPQSVQAFGGYVVQGKKPAQYQEIIQQARAVQDAGAFMLVLEGIPEELGREITQMLDIPTVGIGAGRFCDGQVLVYHDLLGMFDLLPRFVKRYATLDAVIPGAIGEYVKEVKSGEFPQREHVYVPVEG
jgi:3-methyl-2-oxobutanoate hydroxymethyltransferase